MRSQASLRQSGVRRPASGPGCNLARMSAEPVQVDDPNDPEVVLRDLPERERAEFLRQYHEELAAVRSGKAQTRPAEEAFPDWQEQLTAARAQAQRCR